MYVYQITDSTNGRKYIGVDTRPKDKLARFEEHKRVALYKSRNKVKTTQFYRELARHPDTFAVSILYESDSIADLFLTEIELIEKYDTYHNGYNSTKGGDCFGQVIETDAQYDKLVEIFSERMVQFNRVKWDNTTLEQRKEMLKLHTPEANLKRSKTIKSQWDAMPEAIKNKRLTNLKEYISDNHAEQVRKGLMGSKIATELNKKAVTIKCKASGEIHKFDSYKAANEMLKTSVRYLLRSGSKKWEIVSDEIAT